MKWNCIIFENYSDIDHDILNKTICDLESYKKPIPPFKGHFALAYVGGSINKRAYLVFIYDTGTDELNNTVYKKIVCMLIPWKI